jgi:hypothetical protein
MRHRSGYLYQNVAKPTLLWVTTWERKNREIRFAELKPADFHARLRYSPLAMKSGFCVATVLVQIDV